MFLVALILLLIICCLSTTRTLMKRKTDNESWGEPFVTIAQIILFVCIIMAITLDHM